MNVNELIGNTSLNDVYVVTEGLSYASKGNQILDLSGYKYAMLIELYRLGIRNIATLSPVAIKHVAAVGIGKKFSHLLVFIILAVGFGQLGNENLVGSQQFAPAVHMGDVVTLWVDGDVIRIDAEVVTHFVADVCLVVAVFLQHEIVADAVAAAVFHHVAAGVFKVHAVHRDVPEGSEHA